MGFGPSDRVRLSILGRLQVTDATGREISAVVTQPKRLALLSYLALTGRDLYRQRDTVVALFWPDFDQIRARAALRQALSWLRRELGAGVLTSRGEEEIGIAADAIICDAVEFDNAIAAGDAGLAMDLYGGELLEGVFVSGAAPEFEQWLDDERRRLRLLATRAAVALAEDAAASQWPTTAVDWMRRAAGLSPNDEGIQRRLLQFLADAGDRAGAVEAFEAFRVRLAEEYGTEPAPETAALIASVRRGNWMPHATADVASAGLADPVVESRSVAIPTQRPRRRSRARALAVVAFLSLGAGAAAFVAWRTREANSQLLLASTVSRPPGNVARKATTNIAAYNHLLKSDYYQAGRTAEGLRLALREANQAIELDPLYGDAHAVRAAVYQGYAWYGMMRADEALLKSEASARRALALDSASALGHAILGANLSFLRHRWDQGEREFRRAVAIDSLNAQIHNFYAIHLRALGRFNEALREMRIAQNLDQMYRHYYWSAGFIQACAGRDDSAVVEFQRAVDFDSTYSRARIGLAQALFRLGRFDYGLHELRRTFEIAGDKEKAAVVAAARGAAGYANARRRLGEIDLARLRGREPDPVTAIDFASAFIATGEIDSAITALERALSVQDPRLQYVICPDYGEVRDDPRVRDILRRMNLR